MKKLLGIFLALGLGHFCFAQDEPPVPPTPPGDKKSEEIVIRNNGDKELTMTVQINGDSILVNGKPLNEFIDSQVSIRKRKIFIHDGDRMMAFDFDNDNFRKQWDEAEAQRNQGQKQWDEAEENFNKQWKNNKEIIKPFLGVTTENTDNGGAKVVEVVPASAAEKSGLKEGDIITKINDKKVDNPEMLSDVVASFNPKEEVKIRFKRSGKEKMVTAVLGEHKEKRNFVYSFKMPEMPDRPEMPEMPEIPEMMEQGNFDMMPHQKKLGIKIQDTEDGKVKVIAVEDSSSAAKAGLKEGDIITEIDGDKINNTDEARDKLHPEKGKISYNIKVNRNGTEMNFDVKIPRKIKTADL